MKYLIVLLFLAVIALTIQHFKGRTAVQLAYKKGHNEAQNRTRHEYNLALVRLSNLMREIRRIEYDVAGLNLSRSAEPNWSNLELAMDARGVVCGNWRLGGVDYTVRFTSEWITNYTLTLEFAFSGACYKAHGFELLNSVDGEVSAQEKADIRAFFEYIRSMVTTA